MEHWIEEHQHDPFAPKIIFVDENIRKNKEAFICANGVIYFQTSMDMILYGAGLPLFQVGNIPPDKAVKKGWALPFNSNATDFTQKLTQRIAQSNPDEQLTSVKKEVGMKDNYLQLWEQAFKSSLSQKNNKTSSLSNCVIFFSIMIGIVAISCYFYKKFQGGIA